MFGISFTEILLILLIILIVFGPEQLPQLASKAGKLFGTVRKTSEKFRREFYNSVYKPAEELEKKVKNDIQAIEKEANEVTDGIEKITEEKDESK